MKHLCNFVDTKEILSFTVIRIKIISFKNGVPDQRVFCLKFNIPFFLGHP